MGSYSVFAERERNGWTNTITVGAYVEKFGPITNEVARSLVGRASARGKDVLDLCCGQGALTAMLVEAGADVTGLDFSRGMLSLAKTAAPDADLQHGDAATLPFDRDSFDVVVCNFGMMHLPDQPKALCEICRVLRPGGQFLMATWATPENSPALALYLALLRPTQIYRPRHPSLTCSLSPDRRRLKR